jgi:stage V sporulation protein AC
VTNKEYAKLVKEATPNSPLLKDCCFAFLIGGAICTLGQAIMNFFLMLGLDKPDASSATSITLIFLGALFTGLKLYDDLAKIAGAGTLVPITGFANAIVSPALEFKSEGYVTGMSAKMFTIAGPVLVFGISASVIYGLIAWLFGLY